MTGVRTRKGNVFSVRVSSKRKKYFQYIANDLTQLNSDVIRAFKKIYPAGSKPELKEIVSGEVEFYAHVVVSLGVKMRLWEKVGNVPFDGKVEVYFRDYEDWENPRIKSSAKWSVWMINEKMKFVGKLKGALRQAEIGIVVAPQNIVDRMRTGKYDFAYKRIKR